MALRGLRITDYTYDVVREVFIELFCAPRSSLDNPNLRSSPTTRSFCVLEDGDMDGVAGYWVEDEDTAELGFLPEWEDVFWTFDDNNFTWASAHFQGRKLRRGQPRHGGKGRGKGGHRRFRKRGKGKGQGHSHLAEEEWANWSKGKGKKGKGKGKSKGDGKSFGKFPGKFQGKGKGKSDHKGEGKGKGPSPDSHLVDAIPPPPPPLPSENRSSGQFLSDSWPAESWEGLGWDDAWWTDESYFQDDWSWQQSDWNQTSASWSQSTPSSTTAPDYAGFYVEEALATTTDPAHAAHLSYTVHKTRLSGDSIIDCVNSPLIDLKNNPTYVILDLGCTRAMGSRSAIEKMRDALRKEVYPNYYIEILPTNSNFNFANSQSASCTEKCRIWFPFSPAFWTDFDIVEEGNVPLLMSLVQMRNLYFEFWLSPESAWLRSPAIGRNWIRLECSTTRHLVLDLRKLISLDYETPRIITSTDADRNFPSFKAGENPVFN